MIRKFTAVTLAFATLLAIQLHASLVWDRTEVTLDMEPDDQTAKADFIVTNHGDATVRIARIKSNCGCTASVIDRRILEPGDSTKITGTFNRGRRSGVNLNSLQVFVDGQPEPAARLVMRVRIPKLIEAKPQLVYWSPGGSRAARMVKLTLDERYVDTIEEIDFDAGKLDVVHQMDGADGTHFLKVSPKEYAENFRSIITVRASGKDGRIAESKIQAFVRK